VGISPNLQLRCSRGQRYYITLHYKLFIGLVAKVKKLHGQI